MEARMSSKYMILMLLICVVAMGGVTAILFFGVPVNGLFLGLMILLCPLSHLLMMKYMGHGSEHCSHERELQKKM
jgi:hypothetical protein